MKTKVTEKQVQEKYKCVIIEDGTLNQLFPCCDDDYYTCGPDGRNAHIFVCQRENYAIVRGPRPFGERINDESVMNELQQLDTNIKNYNFVGDYDDFFDFYNQCKDKALSIIQNYFDANCLTTIEN